MDCCTERSNTGVPPEETFLQRLLDTGATESSNTKECSNGSTVESGLATRKSATVKIMKSLVQAIDLQRSKNAELAASLRKSIPPDGEFCIYFIWRASVLIRVGILIMSFLALVNLV